jgi:hypothetical protein
MGEKLTAATLALIGYEVAVLRYGHDAVDTILFLSDDDTQGQFDEPKPGGRLNAVGEWRVEARKDSSGKSHSWVVGHGWMFPASDQAEAERLLTQKRIEWSQLQFSRPQVELATSGMTAPRAPAPR